MTTINFETHMALGRLYADYALAVDSGHWDLWPEFFTEQCVYKLIPRENHERGFPLCTLSFTSKGMLKDRVYGIQETLYHDPYYQRHVVGAPVVRRVDGERHPVLEHRRARGVHGHRVDGARDQHHPGPVGVVVGAERPQGVGEFHGPILPRTGRVHMAARWTNRVQRT